MIYYGPFLITYIKYFLTAKKKFLLYIRKKRLINNNINIMSQGSVKDILKDKKKVRFVAESAFKQVDKDGTKIYKIYRKWVLRKTRIRGSHE